MHPTLPSRESRAQRSPVTGQVGPSWESWSRQRPSLPQKGRASRRLLLWAVAGMRGCSAGSAGRLAPAQALALARAPALALAAGCLGSAEAHWSGGAGFSRSRGTKEFSSAHPWQQAATDILPTPGRAARDKPVRSPGRRSS